jgi:hypothetical protein
MATSTGISDHSTVITAPWVPPGNGELRGRIGEVFTNVFTDHASYAPSNFVMEA